MIALTALMAIMHMMASISMSHTLSHILEINAVMDMVIMVASSITAFMATLAVMDIRVWIASNVVRASISLVGLVTVLHLMTSMAVMMYWS